MALGIALAFISFGTLVAPPFGSVRFPSEIWSQKGPSLGALLDRGEAGALPHPQLRLPDRRVRRLLGDPAEGRRQRSAGRARRAAPGHANVRGIFRYF